MEPPSPTTIEEIRPAAVRIGPNVHRTQIITSRTLNELTGASVFLKAEHLQVGGAFKIRGATNRLARILEQGRPTGVFAPSSGNHAQAVAIAAARVGLPATILMPEDAPSSKIEATRGYGAEIVFYDRYAEDRDGRALEIAEERGLELIPPYDHPDVIAGQGTIALEIVEQVGAVDAVLVPVGGGGLIAGISTAMAALQPACRVIGIEPEADDDARRSLATGSLVRTPTARTIADGQQAPLGETTFALIRQHVERIEPVSDDELVAAMVFLFERCKQVVEPSGASGLAGLLRHAPSLELGARRVAVVLSGGNISARRFAELTGRPPNAG